MRYYKVSEAYLSYLNNNQIKVSNVNDFMGIPIRLNELIYLLPVTSLEESDFENNDIRKSTPTILRMIDSNYQGIGKCLLSDMYAIPYKELVSVDFAKIANEKIGILDKRLIYLKRNMERIQKSAERLYKQKIKGYNQPYLNNTIDFEKTERLCIAWEIEHFGKHINRFPDNQYFLINPFNKGITEYYLMNQKTKIALIEIDNANSNVVSIKEVYHEENAPLECFDVKTLNSREITNWFRGRGIPSWRDGLDDLLDNLGITSKDVLLNKAYGLSLSDQYWMNPVSREMDWNEINFFDNDFNSHDFFEASIGNRMLDSKKVDLYSPNNTSDGMLKKAWIVGNDSKRYLLKASYKQKALEPFNEVLGSMVCDALNLHYVPYTVELMNQILVSKCPCYVSKQEEFISAYAILKYYGVDLTMNYMDLYKAYITILMEQGITDVENKLKKMFILDYLVCNEDRHLGNFGIIRNVDTLKWVDIMANFDTGQSMFSQKEVYEINFEIAYGCFFSQKNMDFEKILDIVLASQEINVDYEKLEKIPILYKELLKSYQHISLISNEHIDVLINGLCRRIDKLKERL